MGSYEILSAVLSALAAIVTIIRATLVRNAIYEREKIIKERILDKHFIFKDKVNNNIHFHIYDLYVEKKPGITNTIKKLLDMGDYGKTVIYASITGGYVSDHERVLNIEAINDNKMLKIRFLRNKTGQTIAEVTVLSINPDKVWKIVHVAPLLLETIWKESYTKNKT